MLSRGMRVKPIEISQESLGSLSVAVSSPSPKVGGRGGYDYTSGTTNHGTLPEFLYQRHLEVATCDGLIQHSSRISKLSGLSLQMEMLD